MNSRKLPRGIAPELLHSQVKNTMPYLFAADSEANVLAGFAPANYLRAYAGEATEDLTHFAYFKLCLCSHYLSCGTPVPTDVDNQIRLKLWPEALALETVLEMTALVLESRTWDFTRVTGRFVYGAGPEARSALSGHLGEWFTVAAASYGALRRYGSDPRAPAAQREVFAAIGAEVESHSAIFASLWQARDGLGCLKASASIAHNFGDLDRVMDMWELPVGDPLRLAYYKLGAQPFDSERRLRHLGRLWVAGELYKSTIDGSSLALENHRHFALRKPRVLRQKLDFLIPTAPFFDEWGRTLARDLTAEDADEVLEVLRAGWERQPKTLAYGRAMRGMVEVRPDLGAADLDRLTPEPERRRILATPQAAFEKRWAEQALAIMDEIPSRAT